jgi:hypothetical protein
MRFLLFSSKAKSQRAPGSVCLAGNQQMPKASRKFQPGSPRKLRDPNGLLKRSLSRNGQYEAPAILYGISLGLVKIRCQRDSRFCALWRRIGVGENGHALRPRMDDRATGAGVSLEPGSHGLLRHPWGCLPRTEGYSNLNARTAAARTADPARARA